MAQSEAVGIGHTGNLPVELRCFGFLTSFVLHLLLYPLKLFSLIGHADLFGFPARNEVRGWCGVLLQLGANKGRRTYDVASSGNFMVDPFQQIEYWSVGWKCGE